MKLPYIIDKFINKKFSSFYTEIFLTVHDKNNKVISRKKLIGKSLTANFLSALYGHFNAFTASADFGFTAPYTTNRQIYQLSGSGLLTITTALFTCNGITGQNLKGIAVGTGTTPPTPQDFNLETPIAHGTGAGQLEYLQNRSSLGVTVAGQTSSLVLSRTFVNNSGGAIGITEAVILADATIDFLFYRDIFTVQTVNDSQSITVDIQFNITT